MELTKSHHDKIMVHHSEINKLKADLSESENGKKSLNTKVCALMNTNQQLNNNKRQPWFESKKEGRLTVCSNSLILETQMECKSTEPLVTNDEFRYWQDWVS